MDKLYGKVSEIAVLLLLNTKQGNIDWKTDGGSQSFVTEFADAKIHVHDGIDHASAQLITKVGDIFDLHMWKNDKYPDEDPRYLIDEIKRHILSKNEKNINRVHLELSILKNVKGNNE